MSGFTDHKRYGRIEPRGTVINPGERLIPLPYSKQPKDYISVRGDCPTADRGNPDKWPCSQRCSGCGFVRALR